LVVPGYPHHITQRGNRRINFRENWKGHLWQERFHSFVMDEHYLLATVRYTELNPIRARLCPCPADWPWSSARAHLDARDDSPIVCLIKLSVEPGLAQTVPGISRVLRKKQDSI
jgi:hypothetical protein